MIFLDPWGYVLIACAVIALIATGALITSLANRRLNLANKVMVETLMEQNEKLSQQVAHNTRNAKMVKQALEKREARIDAEAAAAAGHPIEVTIVNNASEPVPVEDVNLGPANTPNTSP